MVDLDNILTEIHQEFLIEAKKSVNNITGGAKVVDGLSKPQKPKKISRSTKVKTETPKIKTPKTKLPKTTTKSVVGDFKATKISSPKTQKQSKTVKTKKPTVTTTPPKQKTQTKTVDPIKKMTIRDGKTGKVQKTLTAKPRKYNRKSQILAKDVTNSNQQKTPQSKKELNDKIAEIVTGKKPEQPKKPKPIKNVVAPVEPPKFKGNPEVGKQSKEKKIVRVNGKTFKVSPSKYEEFKRREAMRKKAVEPRDDGGTTSRYIKYKNLNGDSSIISYLLSPRTDYAKKKDCKLIVRFADGSQYTYLKKMLGEQLFNQLADMATDGKDLCKTIQKTCYNDYFDKVDYDTDKPLLMDADKK